ncbi:hypothetical protein PAXINDRAFT_7908 [Paxillus involutus ATCC 200175]|nr:hypothetical protein PAXINDRAFT_7908 [Paxillus involutus ATCC 200175]
MVYIRRSPANSTSLFPSPQASSTGDVTNHHNINYALQAIPLGTTATSHGFWWQYPAVLEDTDTTTPFPTSTSVIDVGAVSSVQSVTPSSNSQTASVIQITALSPATTLPQPVLPKLVYQHQLNIIYLVPLFAVLGIIFGIIAAIVWLKWRENRQRRRRASAFQSGPPYVPPEHDAEDHMLVGASQSMEQVSLFAAGTPSKVTIHGSRYTSKRSLLWPSLGRTQQPLTSQLAYGETIIPSVDGERFTVVVQEDPFLMTPQRAALQSARSTSNGSLPRRISPSLSLLTSEDHLDHPRESGADLQKPIRRSMFDLLKLGSHPLPSEHREYVAVDVVDDPLDTTPTHNVRRANGLKQTMVNSPSGGRRTGILRGHHSPEGSLQMSHTNVSPKLLGFQDDKRSLVHFQPPVPTETFRSLDEAFQSFPKEGRTRRRRDVTPFPSAYQGSPKEGTGDDNEPRERRDGKEINEQQPQDNYTKAPERHRTRHQGQKRLSNDPPRRSSTPHVHASVLPRSPPLLMSPPLANALFFTSPLSSSTSLGRVATVVSSQVQTFDGSPQLSLFPLPSKKTKMLNKLRTNRPAPPLPYPSYPDELSHATANPQDSSTSIGRKEPVVPPGSPKPKGRSTSATSRETANGMWSLGSVSPTALAIALVSSSSLEVLNKVDEIVARGYGENRVRSGN